MSSLVVHYCPVCGLSHEAPEGSVVVHVTDGELIKPVRDRCQLVVCACKMGAMPQCWVTTSVNTTFTHSPDNPVRP